MLHELIDFCFFLGSLPRDGQHELLHLGDIGLGNASGHIIAHLLSLNIDDAIIVGR